jgi:hypothetical protein
MTCHKVGIPTVSMTQTFRSACMYLDRRAFLGSRALLEDMCERTLKVIHKQSEALMAYIRDEDVSAFSQFS